MDVTPADFDEGYASPVPDLIPSARLLLFTEESMIRYV